MSVNPERKTVFKKDGRTIDHFEYPEDYNLQQRGITLRGGYYNGSGFFGRNTKSKVGRLVSQEEKAAVKAAKKDIGHKTKKHYSNIAQRKVPKALHSMYGLPMRDKVRPESELPKFFLSHLKINHNGR